MQRANWRCNTGLWNCGPKSSTAGLCMVALNVHRAVAEQEHAYILTHSDSSLLILDAKYLPIWEQIRSQCSGIRGYVLPQVPRTRGCASCTTSTPQPLEVRTRQAVTYMSRTGA
jgi:hypothetical protein